MYSSELVLNGIVTQKLEYERLVLLSDKRFTQLFLSCLRLSCMSPSLYCTLSGTVSSLIMLGEQGQRYGSETAKESSNAVEGEGRNVIKLFLYESSSVLDTLY